MAENKKVRKQSAHLTSVQLRAICDLSRQAFSVRDIAESVKASLQQVASARRTLIKRGVVLPPITRASIFDEVVGEELKKQG